VPNSGPDSEPIEMEVIGEEWPRLPSGRTIEVGARRLLMVAMLASIFLIPSEKVYLLHWKYRHKEKLDDICYCICSYGVFGFNCVKF
jgi:hypothetical protein